MKMSLKILIISVLFFTFILVSAQEFSISKDFIKNSSELIYGDCRGSDIEIRKDSLLTFHPVKIEGNKMTALFYINLSIKWPYTKYRIESLMSEIVSRSFPRYEIIKDEPVATEGIQRLYENSEGIKINSLGYHLFSCGGKFFDANGQIYIWDGKILGLPTEESNFSFNFLSNFSPKIVIFSFSFLSFTVAFIIIKVIKKIVHKNK